MLVEGQLFEEERVAVRSIDDRPRLADFALRHRRDQSARLVRGEGLEHQVIDVGPLPRRGEARPERHHQQDARHADEVDQLLDRLSRRRIAPVDVLDDEEQGPGLRQREDPLVESGDEVSAVGFGQLPAEAVSAGRRCREPGGEHREQLIGSWPERNERSAQLGRARVAGVGVLDPGGAATMRTKGCSGVFGWKLEQRASRPLSRGPPLPELVHDSALADPGLTRDQYRLTTALAGVTPPALEVREIERAVRERSEAGGGSLELEPLAHAGDAEATLAIALVDGVDERTAQQRQHRSATVTAGGSLRGSRSTAALGPVVRSSRRSDVMT